MQTPSATSTEPGAFRNLPWFLGHQFLNSFFCLWTWCGSVFLLFLAELGLPKGQIGILLSLFPFCGLLALGFAPTAARLGWKRVFLTGFGLRQLVIASLLLLPWLLSSAGSHTAIVCLFAVFGVFAVLRALAETAYYPWSQEFIPSHVRGAYGAWSTVTGMVASSAALLVASRVIAHGTGLTRFMLLLAGGLVFGVLSVAVMLPVPGGAPRRDSPDAETHRANLAEALRDRNFVAYLGGMGAFATGSMFLTSFLPLYLKEQLGLPSGTVVVLDTATMVGGGVASLLWGWASDRVGSRPVLMPALALTLLVPVGWLFLPARVSCPVAWSVALYVAYGIASNGVAIGAGRLLFNGVVPLSKSTAYTALYYAWMGVTGGAAPLLAGALLSACAGWQTQIGPIAVDGYRLLFLLAFVLLALGWWWYGRVKPDDRYTTREVMKELLKPAVSGTLAWTRERTQNLLPWSR